jgi:hypothetical protein
VTQEILIQPGANLFQLAANYLGDATQWCRIAQINNTLDPFFLSGPAVLILPIGRSPQG